LLVAWHRNVEVEMIEQARERETRALARVAELEAEMKRRGG
jgi:hypothetical protein